MLDRRIVIHQIVSEQSIIKWHQIMLLFSILTRWHTSFFFNNYRAMDVLTRLFIETLFHFYWGIVLLWSGIITDAAFSLFRSNKVIFLHETASNCWGNPRILGVSFIFNYSNGGVLALSEILLCFIYTLNEVFGSMSKSRSCNWSTICN